jgi:hypothetical protein
MRSIMALGSVPGDSAVLKPCEYLTVVEVATGHVGTGSKGRQE